MTRIDFYVGTNNALKYAARLVRKAYSLGRKTVVLVRDDSELKALDDMLWRLSDTDFLPHVMLADNLAAETPIILCSQEELVNETNFPHYDLYINTTADTPPQFAAFTRLCEIVSKADVLPARERYRSYQNRGYALTSTKIS